jgi:hypothetical protein
MKNNLKDSRDIRTAIENIAREICREETRDCLRLYKATVTMAAAVGGSEMGVKLVGDATELFLPYKSTVSDAAVGSAVWVAKIYGSWRNAIVWDKI